MGAVGSHSEGEGEEEEEEEEEAVAAAVAAEDGEGGAGASVEGLPSGAMEGPSGAAGAPSPPPPPRPSSSSSSSSLPPASVLLGQARLREEAAARLREAPSSPTPAAAAASSSSSEGRHPNPHHGGGGGALVRWLEERLGRGERSVTVEQLREALESRGGGGGGGGVATPGNGGTGSSSSTGSTSAAAGGTGAGASGGTGGEAGAASEEQARNEEVLAQFDTDGAGTVDVENMLEALRASGGACLQRELSHVVRQLQACTLVPGFVDIFSESNKRLCLQASMILRFLHRHRIASTVTPYPVLEYFNNICTMRSSVLKDSLDQLLLKENDCTSNLNGNQEMDKIKSVSKCFTHIEASSNSADIYKMINGETFSFWQSDGSARSHWIRLKMKSDVILRHLSIAVAANDQSYMPQQVTVAVGKTASSLQEVRDVHIPSNVTGYVTLLENANISQMYVQINIKRCLSDGCDTRIHGIRAIGYQRVRKSAVSVCDASAIWCWSLLTSLITASVETNPAIVHAILQNTQKALQHMPPLSLSPGSTDVSSFLSPKVLEEVDSFLLEITSRYATPEVELTLLAFSLARGSITKVLNSLSAIAGHLETPYKAASLIASMATVRQNLLYKYATPLRLTLQACDVKGKEDQSGPENLLAEPWTGDGFLTETGKRRASVILSTGTESALQVTQIRIKVRRGAIGARCGLVFAYSCPSEKFHAEEHFRRFESYDKWTLEDFRQYLKARSSLPRDELGEQDPVGWFELEEEWDEVEVRMQPCRISKYLMVKFLCTRQERAERLGVQGLSVLGYLRPPSVEPSSGNCCRACGKPEGDTVCGTTLLLKTLSFVQQLAQDMAQKKESGLRYKPYLDFSGLDLRLFWNFYSELHQNPREECVDARTMLLRLLQSCFPALASEGKATKPREAAESQAPVSHEAAEELYKHLCEVVDNGTESASLKTLKEEVNNTLLNGAAIFFPQRQSRREQLFAMLKNITEQEHKPSVQLAFKSLCTYFSDRDPGGLLLLPDRGTAAEFNVDQVLSVMETLLMVMKRECDMLMTGVAQQDTGSVLSSLFWSVQGSLLSWCYLQLNGSDAAAKSLAVEILTKYVRQFLASVQTALESLLIQHSSKAVVEKLSNSVLSMVARQLMTFLQDFAPLNIPHRTLLNDIRQLTKLLNTLSADPGDGPNKVGFETWQQEQPVVLRTWTAESPHNYENNCHDVTVFLCPGASYFEVEFDERCETERRYDYLEFTDGKGAKTRYDTKVGTDKWPKKVTFKAGLRLQFLFHSDSSNNEWGYKFTVTAYGLPDVEVSWGLDLHLLVARLMGRLASQSLALKSPLEAGSDPELPTAKVAAVLNSPLWKPVFTHQTRSEEELSAPQLRQAHAEIKEAAASEADCHTFLLNFSKSDPARECCGPNSELFKGLVQACKKTAPKTDIVAGSTIDQAVQSTFAALVYLSPDLYGKLQTYVNSGGKLALSDEFAQVYSLADGIRIWMLEMKQKFLMDQSNDEEEKQDREMVEVNPETLAQQCIQKSLLLLSFLPARTKAEGQDADNPEDLRRSHQDKRQRTSSIVESDFQASDATPLCGATCLASPVAEPEPEPKRQQAPDSPQTEPPGGSHHKPLEGVNPEQEETTSPPSTPTRKPPFNRGRLRLLSFRSMEESRPAPSIKERYPILRHGLDFIKDQSLSHESVLKVLALRKTQAKNILEVLKMILQCLESLGQPHCFVPPCIIFLLELLACQKDFANYFGHLEGCGATLHREIRESYYQLLRFLVKALKGFNSLNNKSLLPALSCVQTSLLHLLDMGWEPSDLSFFVDMQLPQLLVAMSRENMGTYEATVCPRSEEEELADYKQNMEWMDECHEGVFESWCDKISQADPERQRKMHMFIARYRDLLHVDISCDGCDKIAPWHRYRCLQCNDMDLCKTCFLGGVRPEGHEASHDMVSMEHACSYCRGVIVGQRVSCLECEDFDLCFGCHSAKKFADSHPPDHRLAVRPLTTFRISEHHRLIQPYLHNYSWLLFSALALYSADLLSSGQDGGDPLDQLVVAHARTLQKEYVRIIGDCLMKVQQGTGLKSSALLTVMPEGQPSSRDVVPSVDSSTENGVQNSENEDPASNKMRPALFTQCNGGRSQAQASAAPKRKPRAKSASKASNGLPPRKKSGLPEGESRVAHSDVTTEGDRMLHDRLDRRYQMVGNAGGTSRQDAEVPTRKEAEEKSVPSQEDLFAECFQKRVLGLLAAMLPHLKSGLSVSQIDLEQILPLLFRVVISNAGHLNDTYHFTLGLLGQLIRKLTPGEVDTAVSGVLPAEHSLVATGEASVAPEGWKTVHLLFSLGAICLDSRVGLDWASTMADILRALGATEQWRPVVAAFTDHCIKQLPFQLKHTNIFTLLVLVGFPEVLCTGTRSVYVDHANEAHPVVIVKHFAEKNRAVVVDVKTRKRKTVKDLQLIHPMGREDRDGPCQLRPYLQHFVFIATHLLQANPGSGCPEAVEATWVLSLALKGLYRTLKQTHAFEEISSAFLQTGLLKLLVKKCSKGTGFSKTWLLRDLEILSIMLYSSKKEINSLVEHKDPELHEGDPDQPTDSSAVSPTDADQSRMDPLEGLDETTKICFLMTHDALDAPLHILRAMYELQMKRRDSFFLEVQKRFDGDVVTTDERIRTLAQKWQPSKRLRPEEQSSKALDTDMIIVPCLAKPAACHRATEESNPVAQKLITGTESDLQLSYARQRRAKSAALLHKELAARSQKAARGYLSRVNEATAVLYARHVLAWLLATWPEGVPIGEDMLELSGPAHMAYILDTLLQLEEKPLCEKILLNVLRGCSETMLATMALTACQFMEEPGMAVQVRESKHPYNNNTNFEDKVHIPGAIYLSVKFDPQCNTEEGCDELLIASSGDFTHDRHTFSGPSHKWTDFELPGDTLHYRFTSDMSNTEWGYKFTVTAGHLGRFQTGFEILKQMLSEDRVVPHLPLEKVWAWQVGVACRQTGHQRLKAIHLLLRIVQCRSERGFDLTLLKPLWHLFSCMENNLCQDDTKPGVLLPLHRALTELFFVTEGKVGELGCLQEYLLALNTEDHLHRCTAQALKNIAAISLAINYPNKSTTPWSL